MEDSKAHQKITDLGRTIVKELKLDPGVDTLSKWMAHYIAEKIEIVEKLTGKKKKHAQEECFETILKLWEHRWSASKGNSFLRDFESLFETLEKLNPNREAPFFLQPKIQFDFIREVDKEDGNEAKRLFDDALRVDQLARSLICDLLQKAVSGLELTGEREKLIRNAINLIDYPDTRIISFISDYDEFQKKKKDDEDDEIKDRINELSKRIKKLKEFNSFKDALLGKYKKELGELKKSNKPKK